MYKLFKLIDKSNLFIKLYREESLKEVEGILN